MIKFYRSRLNGKITLLKKISSNQLKLGMFIHELHCSWMAHPFVRNQFELTDAKDIAKVIKAGISQVTIDTTKGLDVERESPSPAPVTPRLAAQKPQQPGKKSSAKADIEQRLQASKKLVASASQIAKKILGDVSCGQDVDMEATEATVTQITQMIDKDPHTLVGVSRIKTKDEYTFMHCVSVCALMTAFAQYLGYSKKEIDEISTGALLHDIGKALTPLEILNKPGKLTEEEFVIMKQHAVTRETELLANCGLSEKALDVVSMHHERPDGRGYPLGLKDDELTEVGKMSAIVDIYDALTSVRVYKSAWEPSEALKNMLSWCPQQLDMELTQKFIKMLGVYPVGSLVLLKSGLVGIVIGPGEKMLRPVLKIIYNANAQCYVEVRKMDLGKHPGESIQQPISPARYKIEMAKFL